MILIENMTKIEKLKTTIEKRIKCNNVDTLYNYINCTYRIIVDTNLGIFKISIEERDMREKSINDLLDIVVDQFAEVLTHEIFNI